MKKFLTLLAALIVTGSMMFVHADYYIAGTMNGWNPGDANYKMSGSGPYSITKHLEADAYEFKVTDGSWNNSWGSYDNATSNVTLSASGSNIAFTLDAADDVTFNFDATTHKASVLIASAPAPATFTFPAGTTIYYDFRDYNAGVNIFNSDWNNKWFDDVSNIITCTLNSDWIVAAGTDLYRSAGNGWNIVTCSTVPEDGHNMLVATTDGKGYTWSTYSGPVIEPTPATIKLHSNLAGPDSWADTEEFALAANEETASLTIENIAAGNYQFGVKIDGAWTANGVSFTRDNNSAEVIDGSSNLKFNADVAGDYTFTWTYATNTLSITYPEPPVVVNYETIYFVNVSEWAAPRIFLWEGSGVELTWPGVEMTLEAETVNGYALYSYTAAEGAYANCIFSNDGSNQSADLTWNAGKYYYNGTWYDDIASIPAGPVVVNYETIYFVNTADWTTPRVHLWGGTEGATSWPGEEMTLESETVNGHELYSYTAAEGAYASCIFSDNGNNQSADLTWTAGKYFYSGTWYDDIASIPAESVPTYTVAGVEAVFGTNWDPTNTDNDMTLNAGVYEWSKANITLPAGNVTFKVVKDHDYVYGEWPSSNYELTISEAGIYTIYITFNPSTEVVAAEATKTGNAEVENSAGILGDWDDWAATETLTVSADKESASITKHFDAGYYEFKIVVNGSDYRSNGHWFHRDEWTEADGITSEGTNMSFTADIDGDYTFTWTFATNAISIEFPELTWTEVRSGLSADKYYTICWPKEMLYVRGASVWSFAGKDANMAYLVKEEGSLDAGKPYIIYAEGAKFEAVLVGDDAAAGSNNGLYGTLVNMTNADLLAVGATYMLYQSELRPVGGGHLDANRAYVILDNITGGKPAGMPAHKVRGIPMQRDEATGIDELNASETPRKAVINGQLFIIRGENMFDATGRLVK